MKLEAPGRHDAFHEFVDALLARGLGRDQKLSPLLERMLKEERKNLEYFQQLELSLIDSI